MRTSRKTDFRKLKITLVSMTYPGQRPQCPSLSPHVLSKPIVFCFWRLCGYLQYFKLRIFVERSVLNSSDFVVLKFSKNTN